MRCKACDKILSDTECPWNEERKTHEDLCTVCRNIIIDSELNATMTFDEFVEDIEIAKKAAE